MDLSPRLKHIANKVPKGARLADIGTDHAYLPVTLLHQNLIEYAIASDINQGPLNRGMAVAKEWNTPEDRISFRCCESLLGIEQGEVDTIVIAGMGGDTIAHSLDGVSWSRDENLLFLLQPMSSIPELRLWIQENGFCIKEEEIVKEREKFYVILTVRYGSMPPLSLSEQWVGKQMKDMSCEYRMQYIDDCIKRRERALSGVKQSKSDENLAQVKRLESILDALYEVKEEWKSWQL